MLKSAHVLMSWSNGDPLNVMHTRLHVYDRELMYVPRAQ